MKCCKFTTFLTLLNVFYRYRSRPPHSHWHPQPQLIYNHCLRANVYHAVGVLVHAYNTPPIETPLNIAVKMSSYTCRVIDTAFSFVIFAHNSVLVTHSYLHRLLYIYLCLFCLNSNLIAQ